MAQTPVVPSRGSRCPNCGAERFGRFCGNCGQNDRSYRRSLLPTLGELLRETFEIDSRVARTLHLLTLKPGQLSLEFSNDRRADYLSPIRLYLVLSLAFFFVLSVTGDFEFSVGGPPRAEVQSRLAELEVENIDLGALSGHLSDVQAQRLNDIVQREEGAWRRVVVLEMARSATAGGEPTAASRLVYGQAIDVLFAPRAALDRFIDNAPIAMFLMLPGYAAILTLLYRRRGRYYIEHLVFAVHLQSFVFAIFTVRALLPELSSSAVDDLVGSAFVTLLTLYHLLALRRYYGDGWAVTAGKFVLLAGSYACLLALGLVTVMVATVALI